MTQIIFIAATDTDAGKTTITLQLLHRLAERGFSTAALKPIACGTMETAAGWKNSDALLLQKAVTYPQEYQSINPILFHEFCSPDIAARFAGIHLSVEDLIAKCDETLALPVDYLLIEGCGGWFVPLNEKETFADFVIQLKIPIIFVVGLRLGCINHTLLSAHAIMQAGVPCYGWIANYAWGDYAFAEESMVTLKQHLPWPLLEVMPYNELFNVDAMLTQ